MSTLHDERMARFKKSGLYFVTSQAMSDGRTILEIVSAALRGGVKLIQLREKEMSAGELFLLAEKIRKITEEAGALLIINDRLDIAMGVGADGVHLGQDDFPVSAARKLAPDMIIGVSTHNVEEARLAEQAGASYVNIGPVFVTGTKNWQGEYLGIKGIKEISTVLNNIPFTVMGGIKQKHIPELLQVGAKTIALVTAITAAKDPEVATKMLLQEIC